MKQHLEVDDAHAPPHTGVECRDNLSRTVRVPAIWVWLSIAAAVIAATGNVVGLLATHRIYGYETTILSDASIAQDLVNLALVVPLILVLGQRALRGSVSSYLCWLGCLMFTTYSYAIYTFSIHFGPLFVPWVAVLGLSSYALAGGLVTVDKSPVSDWFGARATRLAGWTLIVAAAAFSLLWLSEIMPDNLAGRLSTSAADYNVPTNPVHVLDLAFFLPAALVSGVLVLRRRPAGYSTAPGLIVFFMLTCIPILVSLLVAHARGHDAAWTVAPPITAVLAVTTIVLWKTLRRHRAAAD